VLFRLRVARKQRKVTDLIKVTILKFALIRCQRQLDRMGASVAAAHLDAAIHALDESAAQIRKASKLV